MNFGNIGSQRLAVCVIRDMEFGYGWNNLKIFKEGE
jgi:hypothetical protein